MASGIGIMKQKKHRRKKSKNKAKQPARLKPFIVKTKVGFPDFLIDPGNCRRDFVDTIHGILSSVEFAGESAFCDPNEALVYRSIHDDGAEATWDMIESRDLDDSQHWNLEHRFRHGVGEAVLDQFSDELRKRFLPLHDIRITPYEHFLFVGLLSLHTVNVGGRKRWQSSRKPTVCFDEKRYEVIFTKHAIEQVCQRLVPDYCKYMSCLLYTSPSPRD